jgi:hypothetical protein
LKQKIGNKNISNTLPGASAHFLFAGEIIIVAHLIFKKIVQLSNDFNLFFKGNSKKKILGNIL